MLGIDTTQARLVVGALAAIVFVAFTVVPVALLGGLVDELSAGVAIP